MKDIGGGRRRGSVTGIEGTNPLDPHSSFTGGRPTEELAEPRVLWGKLRQKNRDFDLAV